MDPLLRVSAGCHGGIPVEQYQDSREVEYRIGSLHPEGAWSQAHGDLRTVFPRTGCIDVGAARW